MNTSCLDESYMHVHVCAGPYLRGGGEGHSPPLVSFSPPLECSNSHDTIELPPGAPPPLLSIPQIRPPSAKFLYTALV